ncbi:hypothetical protein SEA_MARSHA_43 [Mycobacterium phage Marsha]|nr:hypothetical protein SEA_MARSHA_43 [Mycobacterium phage Marsha]
MTTDARRQAFEEFLKLSDELGGPEENAKCGEHDRWQPCRPCLRRDGFYDETGRVAHVHEAEKAKRIQAFHELRKLDDEMGLDT